MDRRGFCSGAGALTFLSAWGSHARAAGREQAVPNSAGSEAPTLDAPVNACDSHHHIYDDRFPVSPHWKQGSTPGATVADYRLLQARLGTTRHVVVQPSTYGIDNRCLVDALTQFGAQARGVAVVDTNVTSGELKQLTEAGCCAIRVNFVSAQSWGKTTPEMLDVLGKRMADIGWHVQLLMTGDQIAEYEAVIERVPTRVVIDHLGRIPEPGGLDHPGYKAIRRLIDNGRTWVKLTEPYEDSKVGPPTYADASEVAKAFVKAAPERMLWGTDWPHPTQHQTKPDDALLLDLLLTWAPDPATRQRILVDNPAELFAFKQ